MFNYFDKLQDIGINKFGFAGDLFDGGKINKIINYIEFLKEENEKKNLISRKATDEDIFKHIVSSLVFVKHVEILRCEAMPLIQDDVSCHAALDAASNKHPVSKADTPLQEGNRIPDQARDDSCAEHVSALLRKNNGSPEQGSKDNRCGEGGDSRINKIIDIGSGSGFPAIICAICFPDIQFAVIDSIQKKVDFLYDVGSKLGLKNLECFWGRIEDFGDATGLKGEFDMCTAMALGSIEDTVKYAFPFLKINSVFLTIKSYNQEVEFDKAKQFIERCGGKFSKQKEEISESYMLSIKKLKERERQKEQKNFKKYKHHAKRKKRK